MQLGDITLPDLVWSDEFDWSGIDQTNDRAVNGNMIINQAQLNYGRPITLEGGSDFGWVTRADVVVLHALAMTTDTLTLTLYDARTFSVVFDRSSGPAVKFAPVLTTVDPDDNTPYSIEFIKLLTVA
ncbi:hypothetical protein [Gynuella sp.]|uniref:hypothetical protein n=1 Tax=Gynuella sp. TaxID=2969146 RepID=UPI003D13C38F